MYNHNKAQQSKNRVHISWDILYILKSQLILQLNKMDIKTKRAILYTYICIHAHIYLYDIKLCYFNLEPVVSLFLTRMRYPVCSRLPII